MLPQGHPRTRGHRPRTLPRMVKAPAGSPRAPVAAHRKLWNLGDPQLQGCSFCSLCHHHGHRYPRRNPEHPHLSSGLPTPLHPPVPRWGGGVLGGDPHLTPGIWPCHPVLSLAPQARCSRHLCSQHHPTGWARRRAAVGPGSVSSARARGRGSRSESPDWSPGSQVGFMRTPSIQLPSGPAWPRGTHWSITPVRADAPRGTAGTGTPSGSHGDRPWLCVSLGRAATKEMTFKKQQKGKAS